MDMNKLTQKSQEAFYDAQNLAVRYGHQEVDAENVALALIKQENGLIPRLLEKMNVPVRNIAGAIENELNRKPKVSGAGQESGKIYISQRLSKILVRAEDEANGLKDEYISVEHIFLAILYETKGSPLGKIFETFGITPDNFLKTLSEGDSPHDTHTEPQDEEQPRADRRAGRRQDGYSRRARDANHARRRAGEPQGPHHLRARHGLAHRRREVPRRVRGTAQSRARRSQEERRTHHPLHRRAAHDSRSGKDRRRARRGQHAEAAARARRAALHRRDDARGVPPVHREGRGA